MSRFERLIPMLLTDFYKTIHHLAYVPKLEYLVSYWTPRKSRYEDCNKAVVFGLQGTAKKYLIEYFNEHFFKRPIEEIKEEYIRYIANTMSVQAADTTVLEALHSLGYLPIRIKALPEGTVANIRTPIYEFKNTVAGYGWLVNYLETYLSVNVWHPINSATVAWRYRKVVNDAFEKSVSKTAVARIDGDVKTAMSADCLNDKENTACGDFSMRGMTSIEGAAKSSAAHLLSFVNTATISAIPWLEEYYNCDCTKEVVGRGCPSTEHSVMSSYGREGEFECYRHLIEDVFPAGPLSMVSDTYDYWNVLTNYLPRFKASIMNRNGKIIIRGDSGDPVDIICGTLKAKDYMVVDGLTEDGIKAYFKKKAEDEYPWNGTSETWYRVRIGDYLYEVTCEHEWIAETDDGEGGCYGETVEFVDYKKTYITPEMKGTVEILFEIFGGYINAKGFKVLDEHIGAIYGDAITYERAVEIYQRLMDKQYAVTCVTLGIGSYTYQCVTRDSLGQALKATNAIIDGKETQIYKDPKTDHSAGNNFKKSQKGMCYVYEDESGDILYKDCLTFEDMESEEYANNMLETIFEDGVMVKEYSLAEIRARLNNGNF